MRRTHSEQDILERGLEGSTKLWIGKDYVNFIYKDFVQLHQPFEGIKTKPWLQYFYNLYAIFLWKMVR